MPILKLSFRAWRNAPFSQLGATLISASLLLCVALLLCLELSVVQTQSRLEKENRITVFLSPSVEPGNAQQISDHIRLSMGSHAESGIQVHHVSPSQTLAHLKEKYPNLYQEILDLGRESDSLVPSAIHMTGIFHEGVLSEALHQIRKVPGVDSVESTESRSAFVLPTLLGFKWLTRFLCLGVGAAWILGWLSLARAHSAGLDGVMAPLRLWGASSWVSRAPGILSGLWVGLPAGVLAAVSYLSFVRPVLEKVALSSQVFEANQIPGIVVAILLLFMSLIAGLASGALSGSAES